MTILSTDVQTPAPQPTQIAACLRELAARGARYHLGLCRTDLDMLIAGAGLIDLAYSRPTALVVEVEGAA